LEYPVVLIVTEGAVIAHWKLLLYAIQECEWLGRSVKKCKTLGAERKAQQPPEAMGDS